MTSSTAPEDLPAGAADPANPENPAEHGRSGPDVAAAIEVAERGAAVDHAADPSVSSAPGAGPVQSAHGDPRMTGGAGPVD